MASYDLKKRHAGSISCIVETEWLADPSDPPGSGLIDWGPEL